MAVSELLDDTHPAFSMNATSAAAAAAGFSSALRPGGFGFNAG
jgi:hypothetical protein